MSNPREIVVVDRISTFEGRDLSATAERLGIPLSVQDVTASTDLNELARKAKAVLWRSASITTDFPKNIGRMTAMTLLDKETKVVNRLAFTTPQYVFKSVQQARVKKFADQIGALNTIETYLAENTTSLKDLVKNGSLQYPFIAKPNLGRRGEGVLLIEKEEDIESVSKNCAEMVFQNFIKNQGDYRVFVIGGVVHDIMRRRATEHSTKSYLNNVSQGGEAERVEDRGKRYRLSKAGVTIASLFDYTIAGVDLIEDEDGKLYFLEINSVPQWQGLQSVTPYPVAEHVLNTLSAIAEPPETNIFEAVRDYFLQKLKFLPINQQFHFLSRIHLWSGKTRYKKEIEAIREGWWGDMENVLRDLKDINGTLPRLGSMRSYRQEAWEKFRVIEVYNRLFFKYLFDQTIFDGKAYENLKDLVKVEEVKMWRDKLLADKNALFALSTPAVNFIYFCDRFFKEEGMAIDPKEMLAIGQSESLSNWTDDCDARIYFYTHCIIGASQFYSETPQHREVYIEMLKEVEKVLTENYASLSLDHKCEFLVCCAICQYESPLTPIIRSEAETSLSPHGTFLVNTQNTYQHRLPLQSMQLCEHSNVLALMAFLGRDHI